MDSTGGLDDRTDVSDDRITACYRGCRLCVATRDLHSVIDNQDSIVSELIAPSAPIFRIHEPEITGFEPANSLPSNPIRSVSNNLSLS
jgi:hypothetical protein